MEKLKKISAFRKDHFMEGSRPSINTLKKLVNNGELPGKRVGNLYFIDMSRYGSTGNKLADQVLGL